MNALLHHELTADWRSTRGRVFGAVAIGGAATTLAAFSGRSAPLSILVSLALIEAASPLIAFVGAARAVRREWRQGTASLWISLPRTEAERLGAKLAVAFIRFAAVAVAIFLLGLAVGCLYASSEAIGPLAAWLRAPADVLALAERYGALDLALLLAAGLPLAAIGLAVGCLLVWVGRHARAGWGFLLVWALIAVAARLVRPLFVIVRGASGAVQLLHFTPAGADVFATVAPGLQVSIWPIAILWAVGAALFAGEVWWLRWQAAVR